MKINLSVTTIFTYIYTMLGIWWIPFLCQDTSNYVKGKWNIRESLQIILQIMRVKKLMHETNGYISTHFKNNN